MEDIIKALYSFGYKLNGTQYKIILCILHNNNYGERRGVELSLTMLSNETNCHSRQIQRELTKLIDMNIVKIEEEYSIKDRLGRWLNLNPPSEWREVGD